MVGKLVGDQYVSKESIKTTLHHLWRNQESMNFQVLGKICSSLSLRMEGTRKEFWGDTLGCSKAPCF